MYDIHVLVKSIEAPLKNHSGGIQIIQGLLALQIGYPFFPVSNNIQYRA